jgi:small subunit ribosomal protein S18
MASYYQRKKVPSFEKKDIESITYQNLDVLKEFVLESGRMVPSRITGTQARYQRLISKSIKQARFLALMPYCDRHE